MGGELPHNGGEFLAGLTGTFPAGGRVAGYRLEEQVGQGGMAVVFRARDERLGRLVALKILAPALVADEPFRQRFIRESRAAAAVDHPHIIPIFEAGDADGVLFIAMRYVPGADLRAIVHRHGALEPARVAAIISQVASALDAAYAAGLVHRDVKPANMLLDMRPDRPDHVYLSDFGLSKAALSASVGLTGTGQFLGTLDYISPEQIGGKPVDGRTDQYALACAAFELLAGLPPFRREEATAMMYAQLSEPPPPITSRRADLPRAANEVLGTALAKAPENRYASCQQFAEALRRVLGMAPYHSGPGAIASAERAAANQPNAGHHAATEIAWPATRGVVPERIPVRDASTGAASPVPSEAVMSARAAKITASPAADPGHSNPLRASSSKRSWKRDWTNWVLILALPVMITGAGIANIGSVANGIGATIFGMALLAVPVALVAKPLRWWRGRRRSHAHAD